MCIQVCQLYIDSMLAFMIIEICDKTKEVDGDVVMMLCVVKYSTLYGKQGSKSIQHEGLLCHIELSWSAGIVCYWQSKGGGGLETGILNCYSSGD